MRGLTTAVCAPALSQNFFRIAGDMCHLLSFVVMFWKLHSSKSVAGISLKTQELYVIVFVARYLDLFWNFLSVYNWVRRVAWLRTSRDEARSDCATPLRHATAPRHCATPLRSRCWPRGGHAATATLRPPRCVHVVATPRPRCVHVAVCNGEDRVATRDEIDAPSRDCPSVTFSFS